MRWAEVFPTHLPTHEQTFDPDAPVDAPEQNTLLPAPTHPPTHLDAPPGRIPTHRPPIGDDAATARQTATPTQEPPPTTPVDAETNPGRCAWCGLPATRPCGPCHPHDRMCDTCRAVPRRPDHHRNPFEAAPGTLGTICAVCRTTIPHGASWPWKTGRICVPCLWADGHKAEQ